MWEGGGGERGEMSSAPEQDSNLLCSLQKKKVGRDVQSSWAKLFLQEVILPCVWPFMKLLHH